MKRPKLFKFLIIFALIAAAMEMDISVASFPAMARYFSAPESAIQSTLSVNFLGFCIAGLFFGPLSDSFGRRRILLLGTLLFTLGGIGTSLVTSLPMMILMRFIQGVGVSGVWVVPLSMISDVYEGDECTSFIGTMNAFVTGAMAFAPTIGGFVVESLGWRANFQIVALLSIVTFITLYLFLPETKEKGQKFEPQAIAKNYKTLFTSLPFCLASLAPTIIIGGYMAYVASAAFLYVDQMGLSIAQYAVTQFIVVGSFSLVSFMTGRIINAIGNGKTVNLGILFTCVGSLFLLGIGFSNWESPVFITLAMAIFAIGCACVLGVIFSKNMEMFPELHGTSAAAILSIRLLICAIATEVAGILYNGTVLPTTAFIAGMGIAGAILSYLVVQSFETTSEEVSSEAA